jgi:hypothetical protein
MVSKALALALVRRHATASSSDGAIAYSSLDDRHNPIAFQRDQERARNDHEILTSLA